MPGNEPIPPKTLTAIAKTVQQTVKSSPVQAATSGIGATIKKVLPGVLAKALYVPAMAGATYGVYRLVKAVEAAKLRKSQQQAFEEMHKFFPELGNLDPEHKKQIFSAIAQLNPELSTNPWIMGSLVSRIGAAQFITPDLIRQLREPAPEFKQLTDVLYPFMRTIQV